MSILIQTYAPADDTAAQVTASVVCGQCRTPGPSYREEGSPAYVATVAAGKAQKAGWSVAGHYPKTLAQCPACFALDPDYLATAADRIAAADSPGGHPQPARRRRAPDGQDLPPEPEREPPPEPEPDPMPKPRRGIRLADVIADLPVTYEAGRIFPLALADIDPDPDQPRKTFEPEALERLGASLARHQEDPIVVRHAPTPERPARCILVHGERRWRAAALAGLERLQARLDTDPETVGPDLIARQAVDNIERADLTAWDLVQMFATLRDRHGLGPTEISERLARFGLHYGRSQISNYLRQLDLPEWAQDLLRAGTFTPSHGIALLPYKRHPALLDAVGEQLARLWAATPAPERQITVAAFHAQIGAMLCNHGIALDHGGWMPDINRYLSTMHLTEDDRAECADCPDRLPDPCDNKSRGYCVRLPCFIGKVDYRSAQLAAAQPPAGAIDPPQRAAPARKAADPADRPDKRHDIAQREAALVGAIGAHAAAPDFLSRIGLLACYHIAVSKAELGNCPSFRDFISDAAAHTITAADLAADWASLFVNDREAAGNLPDILEWLGQPEDGQRPVQPAITYTYPTADGGDHGI